VLRLTAPDESFPAEVAALRFWAGRGTVLLVETDLGAGTMLLERLDPTRSLATLPLAEANHHAGRMMRRLAVPAPSWVLSTGELVRDRLATLKSDWVALGRPVPAGMLAAACTAAETLTSATGDRAVDAALHHEQVLGGEREPWLTVDPCLLRGDIGFDLARCLRDRLHEMPDTATINEQLDIIANAAASTGTRSPLSDLPLHATLWVSSMGSLPSAAGVSPPRCFSDPPFTPTGDHAWQ
jgi:streptomycin 6-kinase